MDDQRTTQALRELAAMYLSSPVDGSADATDATDPPDERSNGPLQPDPSESDAEPADAELVIVGHLPGPANLWINQYAQRRAHDLGREVAVARIAGGRLVLDWFALDPAAAAAGDGPLAAELDLPEQAVRVLRQRGCLWIVVLAEPIDEAVLPVLTWLNDWTLLSGGDEAAVVAGYRLLKQWFELAGHAGADEDQLRVRLAMLGCTAEEAEGAVAKIQRAAAQFLPLTPRAGAHQQRMNPVHRRTIGRFDLDERALGALADLAPLRDQPTLHLAGVEPGEDPDEVSDEVPEATPSAEDLASAHAIWEQLMAAEAEQAGVEQAEAEQAAGGQAGGRAAGGLSGEPEPAWGSTAERGPTPPDETSSKATEGLERYVPGLTALRARCPRHEAVELAVDGGGRIHLLLWSGEAADPIRTLWEANQWTIEHARLLALTTVDKAVQPELTPEVHLFTDEPKVYISLAHRPALRLHALTPLPDHPDAPPVHLEIN